MIIYSVNTPIGKLTVAAKGEYITNLYFENDILPNDATVQETNLLKKALSQLDEYFHNGRTSFNLPLAPEGTPFRLKVWAELCNIPYGSTASYKDVAVAIGCPSACRAVGGANNKNPLPIFIPCHRVIGTNGKLVGYGGGTHIKEFLLNHEKTAVAK